MRLGRLRSLVFVPTGAATALATAAVAASAGAATPAPDLAVKLTFPTAVGIHAPFTVTATVTNDGSAPAPGINVSYGTGGPAISPAPAAGMYCTLVTQGHSGRGGGVTVVGDSCSETLPAGLAPGHSVRVPLTMTEDKALQLTIPFTATPYPAGPQLNVVSHTATALVTVVRPPTAAAPTNVSATETGDQLNVSWTPAAATAPYISATIITATPVGGSTAPVLTALIPGAATRGAVPGVVASTAYSVTVANNDGGGAGVTSQPFQITTGRASRVPGAPTITYYWGYVNLRWNAPDAGNSAIDEYEVLATGAGQSLTSYVSGSTLIDYLSPAPADRLTVTVRAHNLAGWGRWSAPVYFSDGGAG